MTNLKDQKHNRNGKNTKKDYDFLQIKLDII